MLMLKPLPIDWSAADASISVITFIAQASFTTHELAHMLDSLVRVSRRVEWNHLVTLELQGRLPAQNPELCKHKFREAHEVTTQHTFAVWRWILQGAFTHPETCYHAPRVVLTTKPTVTHKARSITHVQIKTNSTTCVDAEGNHCSAQQSHQATLVPSAFLSASSGTFNSLFKVLFIFPSWYLFAIGFEHIFSLRWNLPPNLRSNPEERDS